jgi:hypothetical protein
VEDAYKEMIPKIPQKQLVTPACLILNLIIFHDLGALIAWLGPKSSLVHFTEQRFFDKQTM